MTTSNTITFLLDGKPHSIPFGNETPLKPSTTVLNYLRSLDNHKGVKEGCAEGDCGACTVVVASRDEDGRLCYEAIDSCLVFLPMIHGKQLITVENLKSVSNGPSKLHPVQQFMITENASQCGYCTPGFVMSMFALYKNHHNPTREVVLDALTGNLCRCTGYQPIIHAAQKACQHEGKDHFTPDEEKVLSVLKEWKNNAADLELVGGNQRYFLPASLNSALQLKEKYPQAILISGATDVALRQTKKNEHLETIIDISAVRELKSFRHTSSGMLLGAGISLEMLKNLTKEYFPALYDMLVVFGSLQIRNMATLGGNIGSASPIGDTLPLLFALKASVNLAHANGSQRTMPIEEFITGYRQTALNPGELITSVELPFPDKDTIIRSYKISRRKDLDISTVSAAFSLHKNGDGTIQEIILAYGGMAAKTQRALKAEQFLSGKSWTREHILQAMDSIEKEFTPLSDARSDKEARKIAASNLLMKFYIQTTEGV